MLIILKSDDQPKPSGRVHIHRLRGLHFQVSPKDVSGCRNSKDDNSSGSNFFLLLSINQSFIFFILFFSTYFWCSRRSRHLSITPRGIRYIFAWRCFPLLGLELKFFCVDVDQIIFVAGSIINYRIKVLVRNIFLEN